MGLKSIGQIYQSVDEDSKNIIDMIDDLEVKARIHTYLRQQYSDYVNKLDGTAEKRQPLSQKSLLEQYENKMLSEGKAKNTVYAYILRATGFLKYLHDNCFELVNLDTTMFEGYVASMRKGNLKVNSLSKEILALKSFINFLSSKNYVFFDTSSVKIPKKVASVREVLSSSEIDIIEAYLNNRKEKFKCENLRDRIALYLGLYCGLRRQEIINLTWENIDFSNKTIKIVESKGNKDRVAFFNGKLEDALTKYKKKLRINKGPVARGKCRRKITKTSLQKLIERIFKESGVYRKGLSIHSLRHTCAENMRKKGVDIYIISKVLGHSRIDTTEVYLHANEDDIRTAMLT
jgi:integrase/recombinase XerD